MSRAKAGDQEPVDPSKEEAGRGYSTNNEVTFQGGIILPEFMDRYGSLRIGVLGNLGISTNVADFGPGFEIFVGYGYDIN